MGPYFGWQLGPKLRSSLRAPLLTHKHAWHYVFTKFVSMENNIHRHLFHICNIFLQLVMSMTQPKKVQFKPWSFGKAGSSHQGNKIQNWSIIDMRNVLVFYFATRAQGYEGKKYSYTAVTDSYHVPWEMFRRRLCGPILGYLGHIEGGWFNTQSFINIAHPNILLTPIHLAPAALTPALTPALAPVLVPAWHQLQYQPWH